MQLDKLDIYISIGSALFAIVLALSFLAAYKGKFPSVQTLADLATLFNTKGGIIILLVSMWWITLGTTVCFGIWVIVKGVDPQHGVVITLLGMLISQAFGNVNGALFKTMVGEDPKLQSTGASPTTRRFLQEETVASAAVAPVSEPASLSPSQTVTG